MRVIFLLFFSSSLAAAQVTQPVVVSFPQQPVQAYIDRPGDVYVRFNDNRIIKYNAQGEALGSERIPDLLLFEPRDGARMFSFTSKAEYGFYMFGNPQLTILAAEFALKPALACTSGDQQLWLFDQEDRSLKRIDLARQRVLAEVALQHSGQPSQMRAYQNFLFILTDGALLIANSMGQIVKQFDQPIAWFNFLGEELYFQASNQLIYYDLMDGSMHTSPVKDASLFTLQSDQCRYILFADRMVIESLR